MLDRLVLGVLCKLLWGGGLVAWLGREVWWLCAIVKVEIGD